MVRVIAGTRYKFDVPSALAVAGPDLFVANVRGAGRGSVTEVDASTGALVRVLAGAAYEFNGPDALAVSGPRLFVANSNNGSVTVVPIQTTKALSLGAPHGLGDSLTKADD